MNYSMDWEKEKSAQRIINIYSVAWNGTDYIYICPFLRKERYT